MKHEAALSRFIENRSDGTPVPLRSTSYDVRVESGLAVVRLVRTFRNDEKQPIEATITFPVPFECAVTALEAKVGGRVLTGKAQAKAEARQSYEDAIDAGKPAVLHEELLRGIHMLSVANVAPGADIEVSATFVSPLALADGDGRFRIPVTLGQVYGEQPFVDSDRIVTGGRLEDATVTVSASAGTAFVNGAAASSPVKAPLDRPIEIKVVGLYAGKPPLVRGRAADRRVVEINFSPAVARDVPLDADFLLDVSGSMMERVSPNAEGHATKWDAVLGGLAAASGSSLNSRDAVTVWTFSSSCRRIGRTAGDRLSTLAIPFDGHGTEIPEAIAKVAGSRAEANILLVTDGKSWLPIDVQKAVATGARFTVVLVGEDSLESSVGYLAAMTGGQMFIASGTDISGAIAAAAASMRNVASPAVAFRGMPEKVERRIAGVDVTATWSKAFRGGPKREGHSAAIAAYAAHIAIQGMQEDAAEFAASEGIVSHLTSIVLVDEAAEAVEGIPATRKVALPDPATALAAASYGLPSGAPMAFASASPMRSMLACDASSSAMTAIGGRAGKLPGAGTAAGSWIQKDAAEKSVGIDPSEFAVPPAFPAPSKSPRHWLTLPEGAIDWDANPSALAGGTLPRTPAHVVLAVLSLAAVEEVKRLAVSLGKDAVSVAVALLAEKDASRSRGAARIVRSVLGKADQAMVDEARRAAGF